MGWGEKGEMTMVLYYRNETGKLCNWMWAMRVGKGVCPQVTSKAGISIRRKKIGQGRWSFLL